MGSGWCRTSCEKCVFAPLLGYCEGLLTASKNRKRDVTVRDYQNNCPSHLSSILAFQGHCISDFYGISIFMIHENHVMKKIGGKWSEIVQTAISTPFSGIVRPPIFFPTI